MNSFKSFLFLLLLFLQKSTDLFLSFRWKLDSKVGLAISLSSRFLFLDLFLSQFDLLIVSFDIINTWIQLLSIFINLIYPVHLAIVDVRMLAFTFVICHFRFIDERLWLFLLKLRSHKLKRVLLGLPFCLVPSSHIDALFWDFAHISIGRWRLFVPIFILDPLGYNLLFMVTSGGRRLLDCL